ncbi:MAG: hypothetical protein ABSF92_02365 [Candidatus Acidiferrales bacterium]|jgi:hypothetical protein
MFNLVAGIASVVGVAISIWTLIVATGAQRAAREAREAVRKGNAAEEFQDLSRIADEFLSHIEADQVPAALVRARDLMSAISLASRRWGRFLSVEGRNNFEEAYAQVSIISRSLSANGAPSTPQQKDKMLKICHGVIRAMSNETGTLFSELEESEET